MSSVGAPDDILGIGFRKTLAVSSDRRSTQLRPISSWISGQRAITRRHAIARQNRVPETSKALHNTNITRSQDLRCLRSRQLDGQFVQRSRNSFTKAARGCAALFDQGKGGGSDG